MGIIQSLLLCLCFISAGCLSDYDRNRENSDKTDTKATVHKGEVSPEEAKRLALEIAELVSKGEYDSVSKRMESSFRKSLSESAIKEIVRKLEEDYGTVSEPEFKQMSEGTEIYIKGKRPVSRFWYSVKTTKNNEPSFLYIDVVFDNETNELACSKFAIVNFTNGIPPQLQ